jgi:hypothetical protein
LKDICVKRFARDFVTDQKIIWTSPLRWRRLPESEKITLEILGAGTVGLMAADKSLMRRIGSSHAGLANRFSNDGLGAMTAIPVSLYFAGNWNGDAHSREAGWLALSALADSIMLGEPLKRILRRAPPNARDAGQFGATGGSSFPSQHALAAWSMASVIAEEYPGPLTKVLAYGSASAISFARIAARQHFPSDVAVGSVLGYLVGHYVYGAHHPRELPVRELPEAAASEPTPRDNDKQRPGVEESAKQEKDRGERSARDEASPSVPLDSWVYAAFDRLWALGYAPSAYANLRPWTRLECARILVAASKGLYIKGLYIDELADGHQQAEAYRLYSALKSEFGPEFAQQLKGSEQIGSAVIPSTMADSRPDAAVRVESIYTRYLGIAGTPLADSDHFGQTLINDFGRPYGQGSNVVSGVSALGWAGPVALYFRGEYQRAGALPAYSAQLEATLAAIDNTGTPVGPHAAVFDRFRLLDAYLAWNWKTIQISAGRQSLWWGPGLGGPPNFSDNAQPMDMLRLTNPSPWRLPSFFHWLGPLRWDFFIGLMADHKYPPLPAMDGQKLSFKPTPNLEFGFSRVVVFRPITLGQFWKGFISVGDNIHTLPGTVGSRHGGFDFSYRIPGLRDWLVVYNDGTSDHNPSPLGAPQLSLMNPGFYLPQIPQIPKLDFRAEMAWSDPPDLANWHGQFIYYDEFFHISYTNAGNLMGSWVGRMGHGCQLWSTYWFSPRHTVQLGYRRRQHSGFFRQLGLAPRVGLRTEGLCPVRTLGLSPGPAAGRARYRGLD